MHTEKNRGSIMIEAAIIYPLFMVTVLAMLILGLLKLQQSIVQFGMQKIAAQAAREAAYPGYETYLAPASDGVEIDVSTFPGAKSVNSYYLERDLYSGFFRDLSGIESGFAQKLNDFLLKYTMVAGITVESDISIEGVITPMVKAKVEYGVKLPKVMEYIGAPVSLTMIDSNYAFSSNATEFVRNIDLGVDLIDFLLEKFGLEERVDIYVNKLKSLRDKFGGTGR